MAKAAPALKYAAEIANHDDCPPSDCKGCDAVAYRWVFDPMTSKCFWPQAKLWPDQERTKCCIGWGLSFFASADKARARFLALTTSNKNAYKKIGTHLAKGSLKSNHGLATETDPKTSHFTLFESDGVNLKDEFEIVEKLI